MTPTQVVFTVLGEPKTKGSAKAFRVGKFIKVTNDCAKEKPWAHRVHWTAREHGPEEPWQGPIFVHLVFMMPRPGRVGKTKTAVRSDRRPDADKLTRSVLDALTGVFWKDDGQISKLVVDKLYADPGASPGVRIGLHRLEAKP